MVIKELLKKLIKTYNLDLLALFAVFLFFGRYLVMHFFANVYHLTPNSFMWRLYWKTINISFLSIWAYAFFCNCRNVRYNLLTGRNYRKDRNEFKRDYSQLVKFYTDAEPQKMDLRKLPSINWRQSSGIILGKTEIEGKLISFEPGKNGAVFFVWGKPGSGKTACVIITTLRRWGMKNINGIEKQFGAALVLDLKGDIYRANKKYRNIKLFSLLDLDHSLHYDPLATARTLDDDDRAIFLDNLALILIKSVSDSTGEYFNGGGRKWFSAIFLYELHKNQNISFPKVCLEISLKPYTEWGEVIENSGYEIAMKYIMQFRGGNSNNISGCYSALVSAVSVFTTSTLQKLLDNNGELISPKDLESCIDVYLQCSATDLDLYSSLISMIFEDFMNAALHRKEGQDPPICYVLDEFYSLHLPSIVKFATLLRAYNASLLISTQSISGIEEHYGPNCRKLLMDCAKGHAFLSIDDPDTRNFASHLIGNRKTLKMSNSENRSSNTTHGNSISESEELIFKPEEFGTLMDDESVVIYMDGHYVKAKKQYYFRDDL